MLNLWSSYNVEHNMQEPRALLQSIIGNFKNIIDTSLPTLLYIKTCSNQ